jgi:hypothetical protein
VGEAPGRLSQGPDDVQSPHGEGPCNGDGLQGVRREVGFSGVELAPFAGAHDLAGVRDRGGPIEALAECVAHEGARRGMVATDSRMYVPEELAPLGDGYASLQDAGGGTFVLSILHNVQILVVLVSSISCGSENKFRAYICHG